MNMAIKIEAEVDNRLQGPQTAKGRLTEWSRVRHWADVNVWPPESPMYAVLHNPGRASGSQSDGGMASLCDRHGLSLERKGRAKECEQAMRMLPPDLFAVVWEMYAVTQRERPKSDRVVSEALGLTRIEAIKRLERAYGWLGREMGLPPI